MPGKPKTSKKITVRFSKRLRLAMQQDLIHSGYGIQGKSRWLHGAIIDFLLLPNFIDYVEQGLDINQAELTEVEAFYLDSALFPKLKAAYVSIRVHSPLFEGVQSALIRAAVIYRLMLK